MKRLHPQKRQKIQENKRKQKILRKHNKFRRSAEWQLRRRQEEFKERVFFENRATENMIRAREARERLMKQLGLMPEPDIAMAIALTSVACRKSCDTTAPTSGW